jgi:hypothetical protein
MRKAPSTVMRLAMTGAANRAKMGPYGQSTKTASTPDTTAKNIKTITMSNT